MAKAAGKADKSTGFQLLAVVAGVAALFVIVKLPKPKSTLGGVAGSAGGGQYFPYPQQSSSAATNSLLNQILNALGALKKGGSSSSGSNPPTAASNAARAAAAQPASESVLQALLSGNTSIDQGTLAGIYNIQTGAADFAGDSRQSVGQSWLDSGYSLGDLFSSQETSLPYQDSSQTLDLSSSAYSIYGPMDYTQPTYGGYSDNPSIDYSPIIDASNFDWGSPSGGGPGGGGADTNSFDNSANDYFSAVQL
jgi:hypothetical protein